MFWKFIYGTCETRPKRERPVGFWFTSSDLNMFAPGIWLVTYSDDNFGGLTTGKWRITRLNRASSTWRENLKTVLTAISLATENCTWAQYLENGQCGHFYRLSAWSSINVSRESTTCLQTSTPSRGWLQEGSAFASPIVRVHICLSGTM